MDLRAIAIWAVVAATGAGGVPASAQLVDSATSPQPRYDNVVSANPFGILLELFNAEYERVVTESTTAGIGGSYYSDDDDRYLNADLFWRFYFQERPLDGWAFGAKTGLTNVSDHGTFFGIGFDLNRSWLMGSNDNFYIGTGFGLKRLLGAGGEDFNLRIIPTIRIVNVGIAF